MAKAIKRSASNALGTTQSLAGFQLAELAQYTKEKAYDTNASMMFHLFYVGRDDVHDILKYILSRVTISLYLNMFGFDDSAGPLAIRTLLRSRMAMRVFMAGETGNGEWEAHYSRQCLFFPGIAVPANEK